VPDQHYFDDFIVGQTFTSPEYTVTADEIIAFGRQYDPQPFHIDSDAAQHSVFGRLVASGWHTAAMTMRMLIDSDVRPAGGSVGAGVDSLQWRRPVVAGDVLHLLIRVAELRPSRTKPDRGVLTLDVQTLNAAGEVVQTLVINSIVPRRAAAGGAAAGA
jgi:acyl dehydratase